MLFIIVSVRYVFVKSCPEIHVHTYICIKKCFNVGAYMVSVALGVQKKNTGRIFMN